MAIYSPAGLGDIQARKDLIENMLIPELSDSGLFKLCEDLNLLDLGWLMLQNDEIRSRIAPMKLKPKLHFLNVPQTQSEMETLRERFRALESAKTNWKISVGIVIPFESLQCKGVSFKNEKILDLNFDLCRTLCLLGQNLQTLVLEMKQDAAKVMEDNGYIFRLDLAFLLDTFPNLKYLTFDNHAARDNWLRIWHAKQSFKLTFKPETKSTYFVDWKPDLLKAQKTYKLHSLKLLEIKPGDSFSEFLAACPKLRSCSVLYYFDRKVEGAKMGVLWALKTLSRLRSLRKLEIEAKNSCTGNINTLENIDGFRNLRNLHVRMCYPTEVSDLYRIAISLSHVVETLVSLKVTIGGPEWMRTENHPMQLESFQMGLDEIMRNVSNRLTELRVFELTSFQDGKIELLVVKCSLLSEMIECCSALEKIMLNIEVDDIHEIQIIKETNPGVNIQLFEEPRNMKEFFEMADTLADTASDYGEN